MIPEEKRIEEIRKIHNGDEDCNSNFLLSVIDRQKKELEIAFRYIDKYGSSDAAIIALKEMEQAK